MASACKGAHGEDFGGRAGADGVRTREDFDSGSAEHVWGEEERRYNGAREICGGYKFISPSTP